MIFCVKHLNWISKTADLTESPGRLDERPVKSGETDGVNPQSRHRGEEGTEHSDRGPSRIIDTRASGHYTCGSRFKHISNAYILRVSAESGESAMITITRLLSVINRQAGASVEEGFKCLFT